MSASTQLARRHTTRTIWRNAFLIATIVGILFLATLIVSVADEAFGYVAMVNSVEPSVLQRDGIELDKQNKEQLLATLDEHLSSRRSRALALEMPLADRSRDELLEIAYTEVVKPEVAYTWPLFQSIFARDTLFADAAQRFPESTLVFRSWVSPRFLSSEQSSRPLAAGIRAAILGTLSTILITILLAFPVGIAAAIWLEEYAKDNRLNRFIRVNIYNLAGVPSIIYGMLGLAIFVRALEPVTSGAAFGFGSGDGANGRTILSAGLTLALLILPVIIINAQEALRAIPQSLRQSALAVGASKWQTIWHHVLPAGMDRILTGAVLYPRSLASLKSMADVGGTMLHDAIQAYLGRDEALARKAAAQDDQVDEQHRLFVKDVLDYLSQHPNKAGQAVKLIATANYLERLGDHVTNLCEAVVFMVSGQHCELNE
ncbi:MAG TPA: ABC transporter permease subunit [Spirochaetales bacterium]|nr:ABC transporter permease subunit [Spirochaetales bacterium]